MSDPTPSSVTHAVPALIASSQKGQVGTAGEFMTNDAVREINFRDRYSGVLAPEAEIAFEETFGPVAILEVAADAADARRASADRRAFPF